MSGGPFRKAAEVAPAVDEQVPNFRRLPMPGLVAWIYYGILAAYAVVTLVNSVRAQGLAAIVTTVLGFAFPFAAVLTHRALQARFERWHARRVAREVARLMSRD